MTDPYRQIVTTIADWREKMAREKFGLDVTARKLSDALDIQPAYVEITDEDSNIVDAKIDDRVDCEYQKADVIDAAIMLALTIKRRRK